jgi:CubicO group peptidase (beta-lactamase class C family)
MKEVITLRIEKAIQEHVFPGCVIGVVRKDGTRTILPFGTFTYDLNSPKVQEDTIYDVASLTKSIPTASLALTLIDQGKLKITDKLIDYIPEFNNSDRESVLIKHLLTYTIDGYGLASTLDGQDLASLHKRTAAQLQHLLLTHDFEKRPGTVFKYTNIPAALLGMVIEKIYGETLDVLADKHFFIPLSMERSTFYPEKFSLDEIVPTEVDQWRGEVHGIVHDESAYIAKKEGKIVGHAGLFSTAGDILTYLEMLLKGGELKGKRFFSEEIIKQMETNQIAELNDFTGLGWELNQPRYMGKYCTPHTFGKTGFTGTLCVCDREKGVAYVILSNRIYPKRPPDSAAINAVRADIGEIVLSTD